MTTLIKRCFSLMVIAVVFTPHVRAGGIEGRLASRAEQSVSRSVKWILDQQNENGSWSDDKYPALTAFALWGLARSNHGESADAIKKAVAFIKSRQVHEKGVNEGAIYHRIEGIKGGGLPNYNTAICISALAELDDPSVVPIILAGRKYIARSQRMDPESDVFTGGMGYDAENERPYADLSNSFLAYDAMFRTARFEEQRTDGKPVRINWEAALKFVQSCQNDPQFNTQKWASAELSEKGGFVYRPDEHREASGAYEKDGVLKFRTMPGMTYAGLLSYIYCGVERDDPRVKATVNWISSNWQLERSNRNPDMRGKPEEKEGLFYLYNVMSKGLLAYGQDEIKLSDGTAVSWREEMLKKVIAAQKEDGSWVNDNSRYWEGNPLLVTCYALLTVETALGR